MSDTVLLGRACEVVEIPRAHWEGHLAQAPLHAKSRLAFMTPEHHQVRYFVVRELPRWGRPLPPATIATALHLPIERVEAILAELEKNLFFLVRNEQGEVTWAYPVTVEETAHRLSFSSGEQLYAA